MRRNTVIRIVALAFVAFFVRLLAASADPPPPFVVIVNPSNPTRAASRRFLSEAFLKKTTRWPDGDVIRPVDLVPESSTREKFSQDVLKRSVADVKSYWQQVIFSGRDVPPPELADDEAVVKFVARTAGGVGYVSGSAKLEGVRTIAVE
jgi:ABC-type phosphate transport system substrate-binding protein